jgi:hypothetical protein
LAALMFVETLAWQDRIDQPSIPRSVRKVA